MPISHFLDMERRLAEASGLHPRVRSLVMKFVGAQAATVERIRNGEVKLKSGAVRDQLVHLVQTLRTSASLNTGVPPVSTSKIAGVITIVMDFGALFTTRDWGVAGVLSGIAAAAPSAILE
jgi:hypothetical protein